MGSGWRRHFGNWGDRLSPYAGAHSSTPQVHDSDFDYITQGDIDGGRLASAGNNSTTTATPGGQQHQEDEDHLSPDIIVLKHRGTTYPLHFPAYAIGDGILTVGDLRKKAARETNTADTRRIKLLYKGKNLKDDSKPAKEMGLKQQSEVMCVVSEVLLSPSDDSDSFTDNESGSNVGAHSPTSGRRRKRRGKGKKKSNNLNADSNNSPNASDRPRSPMPAPVPTTPRGKVEALVAEFRREYVPLCLQYIDNPPADEKKRDFEYKRLDETILAKILLKADGIEVEGDEEARADRKALVKEAQAMLKRLDEAKKGYRG